MHISTNLHLQRFEAGLNKTVNRQIRIFMQFGILSHCSDIVYYQAPTVNVISK